MAIAAIQDWLNARYDHVRGIELFKAHCELSATDLFLITLPESPMLRDRIRNKLAAVAANAQPPAPPASEKIPEQPTTIERKAFDRSLSKDPMIGINWDRLSQPEKQLMDKIRATHRDMLFTKGMMMRTKDGPELTKLAIRAHGLDHENARLWKRFEYLRETGRDLEEHVVQKESTRSTDVHRRIQALRTWFSQRKSTAKNPRAYTPEEWDARKAELDQLLLLKNAPIQ